MNFSTDAIELSNNVISRFIYTIQHAIIIHKIPEKLSIDKYFISFESQKEDEDNDGKVYEANNFPLPFQCLLSIRDGYNFIAINYCLTKHALKPGMNSFTESDSYVDEYLALYSFKIKDYGKKFLQEDFVEFYNILTKTNLLTTVEIALEKVILANS
jgi:hypothetical protein